MSKKERYGWDQYKEEGLAELKKLKNQNFSLVRINFKGC